MLEVVITEKGGSQRRVEFDKNEITIGRVQGNDIILPKGNVSKRHSRIVLKDDRFIVVDLKSTNGTYVNGRKITSPLVIKPGDKIYIGDFILTIDGEGAAEPAQAPESARVPVPVPEPPTRPVPSSVPPPLPGTGPTEQIQRHSIPHPQVVHEEPTVQRAPAARRTDPHALRPDLDTTLTLLMKRIARVFDAHDPDPRGLYDEARRASAKAAIEAAVAELEADGLLDDSVDLAWLANAALREAVGLGDLEPLMANESVREIIVEGPRQFLADLGAGLQAVDGRFSSSAAALTVARRLVGQAGGQLDPSVPIYEATLPHGPHVTVIQPPIAVRGPLIEIRRMASGLSIDDLVQLGSLTEEMRQLLGRAVTTHRHIAVVGPSGSGVTTLLGALASMVPAGERILTVEAVPDLSIDHDHVVALTSGGSGQITLRELVQRATLLRGDRLIVDDLRGAEVLDALAALAARQAGGLLGVHASIEGGSVEALSTLARLERDIPDSTLHALLGRGAQVLVQLARTGDGRRRVRAISEVVVGAGVAQARDLYVYDGAFKATGHKPRL